MDTEFSNPPTRYPWKRFWRPRGVLLSLDDGGYLADPEEQRWGRFFNPQLVTLEEMTHSCLVLLGEPGQGKSDAMRALRRGFPDQIRDRNESSLWFDLREFQSDYRLVQSIFECSEIRNWTNGTGRMQLFLDSLDECLLRVESVAAILATELRKLPIDRLSVRIACRSADWPESLETELKTLWEVAEFNIYELAPLRRRDVIIAATKNGLDPQAFLKEIDRVDVVPFAIKPVTLTLLLDSFRRNQCLPKTQGELYADGCRHMCQELNQGRRDTGRHGRLDVSQRFAIACRIAAVMVFGNRYAVTTGIEVEYADTEDVRISELAGGEEIIGGGSFRVDEESIRETVKISGLFSSRGPGRVSFAHQTYAEFLAAHYTILRQMTLSQVMSLLRHPGDEAGHIVPQLHEVAGWLGGMVPGLFDQLLDLDPEALLRGDISRAGAAHRERLVDTLLKLHRKGEILHFNLFDRPRYDRLRHPGLVEQLRKFISNRDNGTEARRVAIEIAEACDLREIQDVLVPIVLDNEEAVELRADAALGICRIGDEESKSKLKPVAIARTHGDDRAELKGAAIRAVWPKFLTAEELFGNLGFPFRPDSHGMLLWLLEHEIVPHLNALELPFALRWVASEGLPVSSSLKELIDRIMLMAWRCVDAEGVVASFAAAAWSRLNRYEDIVEGEESTTFRAEMFGRSASRRAFASAMIVEAARHGFALDHLVFAKTSLMEDADLQWILHQIESEHRTDIRRTWIDFCARCWLWPTGTSLNAILDSCLRIPELDQAFAARFALVQVQSAEAETQRKALTEFKARSHRNQPRPLISPTPLERVRRLLSEFEGGNGDAWWQLNLEMTLKPDSTHYGNEVEWDIRKLPVWADADSELRNRITEAAARYLKIGDPVISDWLGTNEIHRPAFAGFRAACHLALNKPDEIATLRDQDWQRWTAIILAYPISNGINESPVPKDLAKLAYCHAPKEFIRCLKILIDKENDQGNHIFILRKVELCWDRSLECTLFEKMKDLKPPCMGYVLRSLLSRNMRDAVDYARSLVSNRPSSNDTERHRALVAARELYFHCSDACWSVLWPVILDDQGFAFEFIQMIAHEGQDRHGGSLHRISENALADLYSFLVKLFPYNDDPDREGVHFVSPRESAIQWRDSVLSALRDRGTQDACSAMERVVRENPGLEWLKRTLLRTREMMWRTTWTPPSPSEIILLAQNPKSRRIANGTVLLELLVESLQRLEEKLHGVTPAAIDLWNELPGGVYRPKDENDFSNYVKRHLEADLVHSGIVVNREVEIRSSEGSIRGERTDIMIDVVHRELSAGACQRISLIVEVKGCWNRELDTAMENQLVDRYLRENACTFELYLIGWFHCDDWDDKDSRKTAARGSIDEARIFFASEADRLSSQGVHVRAVVLDASLR